MALCADAGGIRDRLREGLRALIPRSGLAVAAAFGFASVANGLLKGVFERVRPPLSASDLTASIDLPASYSFPSGHAMTAFAAATALAVLHPRLRVPALALAGLIAASRPYLGVHYWTDVVVGAALGGLIGYTVARAALALPRRGRARAGAASGLRSRERGARARTRAVVITAAAPQGVGPGATLKDVPLKSLRATCPVAPVLEPVRPLSAGQLVVPTVADQLAVEACSERVDSAAPNERSSHVHNEDAT
jgi:hypothetical protein